MSEDDQCADLCERCHEEIKLFERDSKCCDKKYCKDCLEFCDSCETCSAPLCDDCDELECQACQEEDQCTDMCQNCRKFCAYCNRDYCPKHLIMELAQMAPCKQCSKQPCLDKTHPKESYNYVLTCVECRVEATENAKKRKRFFAPVLLKKEQRVE